LFDTTRGSQLIRSTWLIWILSSVAAHLLVFALFPPFSSPERAAREISVPVNIRLTDQQQKPVESETPRSGSRTASAPKIQDSHGRPAKAKAQSLSYQDLLPPVFERSFPVVQVPIAPGEPGVNQRLRDPAQIPLQGFPGERAVRGDHSKAPYSGPSIRELRVEATNLSGLLNLPLGVRRSIMSGSASAVLLLHPDAIEIEHLWGGKEVRVALFEALLNPASFTMLLRTFEYLNSAYLIIRFHYETHFVSHHRFEFETTSNVFDNELEIRLHRYTQAPVYGVRGGITLEDRHSLKAKERDRQHWAKVLRSPAYGSSVRGYRIMPP